MQLGFVIDHSRCIGCHACTVACKSENDVPLGDFRTWVKYTERGEFPQVRRSFAVLRCNQCTQAPCVTICPVKALDKRPDGIVDVDPALCIGCKSCMQACPYDALYINETHGTAEKCHFCAHRVEKGLAPACAVVCPTEAIVPGDFKDPESVVSRMRADGDLVARKTEAGTGPNVFYKEVDEAGIDPAVANMAGGFLWANQVPGIQLDAQAFEAMEKKAEARTVYDVTNPPLWGWKVSDYVFTKAMAAGIFLSGLVVLAFGAGSMSGATPHLPGVAVAALLALAVTGGLLVADLKRPERFLTLFLHPNWDSWLVRGAAVITAFGLFLVVWIVLGVAGVEPGAGIGGALLALTGVFALLTAAYTGWLFGQAKGRVLWLRRGLALDFVLHAVLGGAAAWCIYPLLYEAVYGYPGVPVAEAARWLLVVTLVLHAVSLLTEELRAPRGREAEYRRALRLVTHGPFAKRRRVWGVAVGIVVPLGLLLVSGAPWPLAIAGALALIGLGVEEGTLVKAGQALPIH